MFHCENQRNFLVGVCFICPGCEARIGASASVGMGASASPRASDSKKPRAGEYSDAQSQEEDPGV